MNTCGMCLIMVEDPNREDGVRMVDIGEYFRNDENELCVLTTKQLAVKYSHLIKEKIYTRKSDKL